MAAREGYAAATAVSERRLALWADCLQRGVSPVFEEPLTPEHRRSFARDVRRLRRQIYRAHNGSWISAVVGSVIGTTIGVAIGYVVSAILSTI